MSRPIITSRLGDFDGRLALAHRTRGRLRYAHIETVAQLVGMTEQDLLDIPRLGPVILADIRQALAREGLQLKEG